MTNLSRIDPTMAELVSEVATRTALAALNQAAITAAFLRESGRYGIFEWDSSNLSAKVTIDTQQGIYVPPASDTSGASGAWVRSFNGAARVEWFGAKGDGATDDAAAINAALSTNLIAHLAANKVYAIASTINLTADGKTLFGLGRSGGVFSNSEQPGAVLKWIGASGGRMVQAGSLTSGVDMHGGGLLNVQLDCNALANVALQVQTIDSAQFENLKILNVRDNSGAIGLYLTSGVASFAPVNCVYRCSFRNINIQVPGAANGFYNNTAATSGGGQNTTFCTFDNVHVTHKNGIGFYLSGADDCTFNNIATSRIATGTGANIYLDGNAVSGKGVFALIFNLVQAGVADGSQSIIADGAFSRQNKMTISGVDGVVAPTISNGAELFYDYLGSGYSGVLATEAPVRRVPPLQIAGYDSADASTLDHYNENVFTPTVVGTTAAGSGTYSVQSGHYIRVGGRVFFDIELVWSAHTGTGNMKIGGLPFASGARKSAVSLSFSNLTFAAALHGYVEASATTIALLTAATTAAEAALPIDTAATLRVSGSYSTV